ncbi:toxin YdaT family protein [Crenobacter cavernae]|uniref:Uncharacterized protein n=1 Tax=Crenobacter cavernae TaxID=2290923 RepID=A0A345Y6T1_9NEIS|nr:toxin YdaT family protein [Crenobacter cavernae]AXK39633.1 hypothetical protein DWG20_09355 [Crenobacter cavernae]
MRNTSQKTLIGLLREAVNEWRRNERWSRETVVDEIVRVHHARGYDRLTGIDFNPPSHDAFARMKANADKLFRWLDDDSKDSNLLPANFIPSVLAALPLDLRCRFLIDLLDPVGLTVSVLECHPGPAGMLSAHLSLLKEAGEANVAMGEVVGEMNRDRLLAARKEIDESVLAHQAARQAIDAALSTVKG